MASDMFSRACPSRVVLNADGIGATAAGAILFSDDSNKRYRMLLRSREQSQVYRSVPCCTRLSQVRC